MMVKKCKTINITYEAHHTTADKDNVNDEAREVDKFLMSGIMNVALGRPLLPNSLKPVS